MRRALCAALLVLACLRACLAPAVADVRIEASSGGNVGRFIALFGMVRRSGQRVVIDGPCYSACTLVLSAIPAARLCVTRRAVLGFHAPTLRDAYGHELPAPEATTALVTAAYPAAVRRWIGRHGGLTGQPIFLRGRALAALYHSCR